MILHTEGLAEMAMNVEVFVKDLPTVLRSFACGERVAFRHIYVIISRRVEDEI